MKGVVVADRVRLFPDDPEMRFSAGLEMVHPTVDAGVVSAELGLEPGWSWGPNAGELGAEGAERTGCGWGFREVWAAERLFFRRVVAIVDVLEGRREFVRSYVETGGEVVVTVRLFGKVNIGDVLPAEQAMRMAMLGVALQVEVVPEWD